MPSTPSVVDIFITPADGSPMHSVDRVDAKAGVGLVGDRYAAKAGTLSKKPGSPESGDAVAAKPRDITLIEIEAIEAASKDYDVALEPIETRRNVLVRGAALNHLVGREFTVGTVRIRGIELCEPCGHLEKLTRPGVRKALIHRGGLRAQILTDGSIARGDSLTLT